MLDTSYLHADRGLARGATNHTQKAYDGWEGSRIEVDTSYLHPERGLARAPQLDEAPEGLIYTRR